jgi:hypothetical protein
MDEETKGVMSLVHGRSFKAGNIVVIDGVVDMHYRETSHERIVTLESGDIFFARTGCEHVAHPRGEARILVIEQEGSVQLAVVRYS